MFEDVMQSLSKQGITAEFKQEPYITADELECLKDPDGGQTLIIIDDNSVEVSESKAVVDAITKARHYNCSIILLLHFIFGSQNLAKIRGNTAYYFLMKSCENVQQVALLGSKMGIKAALMKAYEKESKKPYGYVLLDRRTVTPIQYRVRRNLFDEQPEQQVQQDQEVHQQPSTQEKGKAENQTMKEEKKEHILKRKPVYVKLDSIKEPTKKKKKKKKLHKKTAISVYDPRDVNRSFFTRRPTEEELKRDPTLRGKRINVWL